MRTTKSFEYKKRKRNASPATQESAKKGKVQAQRKFAICSASVSPLPSERGRSRNHPQNVHKTIKMVNTYNMTPAPTAKDLIDFLCYSRTPLLPTKLEYLRDVSSCAVPLVVPKSDEPQPSTSPKKEKVDVEKNKNASGVQALRKKYQEQRLAKQKATSVTKLAKKVKGKNMVRTRSAVSKEEEKVSKNIIAVRTKAKPVVGLRSGVSRKQNLGSLPLEKKESKLKLQRAGLRSGGTVLDSKKITKELTKSKKPAKVEIVKNKVVVAQKKSVQRLKEVGSDFSSDDNEPLLTNKGVKPRGVSSAKVLTRGRIIEKTLEKTERPYRRAKVAGSVGDKTQKIGAPSTSEVEVEVGSELTTSRQLKRDVEKPKPSTLKKVVVKSEKNVKQVVKSDKDKKPTESGKKGLPTTRSKKLLPRLATRAVKKAVIRGLLQKKKQMSLRTLTRLQAQKSLPIKGKVIVTKEKVEKKDESSSSQLKIDSEEKEVESPSRRLRGKEPEQNTPLKRIPKGDVKKSSNTKVNKVSIVKKQLKCKLTVDETVPSKRPVRKCSTVDKMWIDVDGFTSDEEDFVDIKSITTSNLEKKVSDSLKPKKGSAKMSIPNNQENIKEESRADPVKKESELIENVEPIVKKPDEVKKSKIMSTKPALPMVDKKITKKSDKRASKNELPDSSIEVNKDKTVPVPDKVKDATVVKSAKNVATSGKDAKADVGSDTQVHNIKTIEVKQISSISDGSSPSVSQTKVTVPSKSCNPISVSHEKDIPNSSTKSFHNLEAKKPNVTKAPDSLPVADVMKTPNSSPESPLTRAIDQFKSPNVSHLESSHSLIARLANNASMASKPSKCKVDVEPITKDIKTNLSPISTGVLKEKTEVKKKEKDGIPTFRPSSTTEETKPSVGSQKLANFLPKATAGTSTIKTETKEKPETKLVRDNSKLGSFKDSSYTNIGKLTESDMHSRKISNNLLDVASSLHNSSKAKLSSESTSEKARKLITASDQRSEKKHNPNYLNLKEKGSKPKTNADHSEKFRPKVGRAKTSTQAVKSKVVDSTDSYKDSSDEFPETRRKKGRKPSPRAEVVKRRERPKRLCSGGKSWIDRDSDDSSFYDEDNEEQVLELIRRSEQELMKRQHSKRYTEETEDIMGSKEGSGTFSESDDEPLMKKAVGSPSSSLVTEDRVSTKNVVGKSEVPEDCNVRAGTSGLVVNQECVLDSAITFIRPPREPINTDGLDLLSEVVAVADKSSTIQQWLKGNRKGYLGFDETEFSCPPIPSSDIPDPVLQFVRTSPEAPKAPPPTLQEKTTKKAIPKPDTVLKRPPVSSVHDLLKLQRERKGSPKPTNEQHSKNCKCDNCVVMKGWFKNKRVPGSSHPAAKEAPLPFQTLQHAFGESTPKVSVTVAPIVQEKDSPESKASGTRKLSFLERMREREKKEATIKAKLQPFSPSNESSVYAFEPESEKQSKSFKQPTSSGAHVTKSASTSTSTSTSHDESMEDDPSRHQSTSIAVQVNLDSGNAAEEPPPSDDGKSIEISTQTEGAEDDTNSQMFYIPLQQSNTATNSQTLIQGVTVKLGTEGPFGPNQKVVMQAKLVTKTPHLPSMKAVVMPQKQSESTKNTPPVGTVQPTTRKPPAPRSRDSVSPGSSKTKEVATSLKVDTKCQTSTAPINVTPRPIKESAKQSSSTATEQKKNDLSSADINMVEAPTFHLTEKEFQDPLEFFERIRPAAESFGICRIVPPTSFKPDCKVTDDMRFTAYNQYVHRMLHRWGPNVREAMAMKKYLKTQRITLKPPPCVGGMEVDLSRLYQAVQATGGLMKVIEKQKWQQVADMLRIPKAAQDRATKLDSIYCKYLLPYETLSSDERKKLLDEVDKDWEAREQKPPQGNEAEIDEDEDDYIEECEECIVKGRSMALNQFFRIARNTMSMWFKSSEPSAEEVESEFWRHVTERKHHVCVHSGSIDSSGYGYGFPVGKNSFAKHPWNLKVLTNNSGSVLRSLGPVMGVTVPTLHVGMVFAAFCWYRDPHGLPWVDYLHTGAPKIWYGISDDNSTLFREALTKLLPRHIKEKRIWLPCDTAMAPPARLAELGVPLSRTTQQPGQFVLVFPRAFTSSLCTGYLVSESVYFARASWLQTAEQAFRDIQDSKEPSVFSLDNLLLNIAADGRASLEVLNQVLPMVQRIKEREENGRRALTDLGVSSEMMHRETSKRKGRSTDPEPEHECDTCRASLYLSMVSNSTEETVYCLRHGIEHITAHPEQVPTSKLLYTHDQDEIVKIYEKLEEKIGAKSIKKK